jgi:predicted enzyme related to lactoylglutathione lyase
MKHNPVGWFEIYVQDMKKAKAFYEAVLQVKLEEYKFPELEMWGFPHAQGQSGAGGALVKMAGVQSGGNSTLVYFSCANCADEVGRVIKRTAAEFLKINFQLVSTVLSPWRWTPKATCSVCIQ